MDEKDNGNDSEQRFSDYATWLASLGSKRAAKRADEARQKQERRRRALLRGLAVHGQEKFLQRRLYEGLVAPFDLPASRPEILKASGGIARCWEELSRTDWRTLFTEEELAPWTPEFIGGLRVGGALWNVGKKNRDGRQPFRRCLYLMSKGRSALVADVGAMPFPHRLGAERVYRGLSQTCMMLSRCPLAAMPAMEQDGLRFVAGWLAACRLEQVAGEWWLVGSGSERSLGLLAGWGVAREPHGKWQVRVSPFYGAIMSPWMPAGVAWEMVSLSGGVGGCPELPAVYWALTGPVWMMNSGDLPYGCSVSSRYNKLGLKGVDFARLGLSKYGISFVGDAVLEGCRRWMARSGLDKVGWGRMSRIGKGLGRGRVAGVGGGRGDSAEPLQPAGSGGVDIGPGK